MLNQSRESSMLGLFQLRLQMFQNCVCGWKQVTGKLTSRMMKIYGQMIIFFKYKNIIFLSMTSTICLNYAGYMGGHPIHIIRVEYLVVHLVGKAPSLHPEPQFLELVQMWVEGRHKLQLIGQFYATIWI